MEKDFYQKSINTLELPAVLRMLADEAVSETAKENCMNLQPLSDAGEVKRNVDETTAAYTMMTVRSSPPFSGIKDIRPYLERAVLGGSLNTRELLDIAGVLRTSRLVKSYVSGDDKIGQTCIDCLFNALATNKSLEERIFTSIIAEDEIADCASSDLSDIRRKMRTASAKARDSLQKIISSPSYAKALQENIITMRQGRYVVPVKAERRADIPGLVHDVSATGATLFVEPMGAVKANNELRELSAKEKAEIEKILAELSYECAQYSSNLESDYVLLTRLDFIFAKAKLSYKLDCCAPASEGKNIVLKKARHPLLDRDSVVPIDIELGESFDTLVITGPNTGGKTVTLKTVGLLALMHQCGLHIPVSDGSVIPVFSHVYADIGDEQSIEQSLSTFSSHMTNIVSILNDCDDRSLVLFDELGAGTDPAEGAALAVSIIENVRKKGALTVATTHYTELKVYATNEDGVQNASCEFDVDTLRPTYRLLIGIPGKSNAFAISKRLGLSEKIISEAKAILDTGNANFENTIEKLENTRAELEREIEDARKKLLDAEEKNKAASKLKAELEVRLEKADIKARREAEEIIRDARSTAEEVFKELDEMKAHINDVQNANDINNARSELRRRLNKSEESYSTVKKTEDNRKSSRDPVKGDVVEIKSMGVKGEVTEILADGMVTVRAGIMNVSVSKDDVYLLEGEKIKEKKKNSGQTISLRTAAVPHEIDLRGMESVEAVAVAEQYLDNALMAKQSPVTIIHGKGTGALRTAIHQMLKKNKTVKSYRLGSFGEGESGVTIVELKIK